MSTTPRPRDARVREELGAWWAEEFPCDVLPTEALIRLSERLAALSPVSRIRATGSIDDGRDRRLPDPQTVTDAFGVPFMQISTPASSPSADEEARGLAPCQCGVGVWLGAGRDPRAHASLCPTRLRDAITTALTKRSEEAYRLGELAEAARHADCCVDQERLAHLESCLAAGDFAKTVLFEDIAKRDAEIAEYAAHEEQTHRILGGILGTDDSLERCAKRMRERAEAAERSAPVCHECNDEPATRCVKCFHAVEDRAEAAVAWAMCEERRRQGAEQSVTCWQADSTVWQARFSDAAARLETMRAVVEAAREVADSPAEFDDERIGYVVLQVNRIDLSGLRQALGALDI